MSGIEAAFFGSLAADAESKVSKNGKPYLRIRVRVGDGDTAQWVSCMVFDPDAIGAADRMTKGARVYVEGRISLDEWTGQDGTKRCGLSCMSFHTRLAEIGRQKPPRSSEVSGRERAEQSAFAPPRPNDFHDDEIPL